MIRFCFLFLSVTLITTSQAQSDSSLFKSEADSLAFIESINQELAILLSNKQDAKSYFDINAGIGNGYFAQKSKGLITETKGKVYYELGAGYYHKSGLSISGRTLLVNDQSKLTPFQASLNPAYDYTKGKKWGFGISYTRYFNKDSLDFYVSPLVNEFYGYGLYKGGWLQTSLGIAYASGSSEDAQKIPTKRIITRPNGTRDTITIINTINTKQSVQDVSMILTLQHSFSWGNAKNSYLFTPSVMITGGTQQFGLNMQTTGVSVGPGGNSFQLFNRTNSSTSSSAFTMQNLSFNLYGEYAVGKFYVSPQLLLTYLFPSSEQQFIFIANLTCGFTF